jgi:RNA polymerase sigma factor (sigma-70 family)
MMQMISSSLLVCERLKRLIASMTEQICSAGLQRSCTTFSFLATTHRRTKFGSQFDPEDALKNVTVAPMQDVDAELSEVKTAMMKLSAGHRDILVLVCVKGMRYEEVAEMLQIPVGTVRSRLSRAREQLLAVMDTPCTPANTNISAVRANIAA